MSIIGFHSTKKNQSK